MPSPSKLVSCAPATVSRATAKSESEPLDDWDQPVHNDSSEEDEELLIERTWELSDEFESFEAESAEDAINQVLEALKGYLERLQAGDRN